jgi:hypothetical protein
VAAETQAQVQTLGERLARLPLGGTRYGERTGAAMLGVLRAGRGAAEPPGLATVAVDTCRALPSPTFSQESSQSETSTKSSLADSQAGTLQVQARTGFLGVEYPGQESFLMPFNTATAWIGAAISVPPHGSTTHSTRTLLDVSGELSIEQTWEHSPWRQVADATWSSYPR